MMRLEIKLEIWAQYTCRSTLPPPVVIYWMKNAERMEPMGLRPPRKATAMPLKPMPGTAEMVVSQSSIPVRNSSPAPIPASAPEMSMVVMMFRSSFIPAYRAAL